MILLEERLADALRDLPAPSDVNRKNISRALQKLKIYATNFLKWLIAKGKQKFGEARQPSNLTDYKLSVSDLQDSKELNLFGILLSSFDLADFQESLDTVKKSSFSCRCGIFTKMVAFCENMDDPKRADAFSFYINRVSRLNSEGKVDEEEEDDDQDLDLTDSQRNSKKIANLHALRRQTGLDTGHFTFNVFCNSAHVIFQETIKDCHAVVMASGTLSPLDGIDAEFRTDFKKISIRADEVFDPSRIFGAIIKNTLNGELLNLMSGNVDREIEKNGFSRSLRESLRIISEICKHTSNGILVYVSSYKMLRKLQIEYEKLNIDGFGQKVVIWEDRNPRLYETQVNNYTTAASGGGAVLFAVCRGKMSEGIDFKDELARAVIILGWPYPSISDPQFKSKKAYDSDQFERARRGEIEGSYQWLAGQELVYIRLYRALNQAAGRAMRHKKDYGAIILVHSEHNHKYITNLMMNPKSLCKNENTIAILNELQNWMHQKSDEMTV